MPRYDNTCDYCNKKNGKIDCYGYCKECDKRAWKLSFEGGELQEFCVHQIIYRKLKESNYTQKEIKEFLLRQSKLYYELYIDLEKKIYNLKNALREI